MPLLYLGILVELFAFAVVVQGVKSRRKKPAGAGEPKPIKEERFVQIGGMEQWISIRGEDRHNPVLLIIHGGPGSSYSIFAPLIRSWERFFTIVQWDQPGAGKTYARAGSKETGALTFERVVEHGLQVSEFVASYLQQPKVVLLGSSFGSLVSLEMARQRPELFHACVVVDQNVGMARYHAVTFHECLERLRVHSMGKGVAALERMGPDAKKWQPKDFAAYAQWTMKSDPPTYKRTMRLFLSAFRRAPLHTLRQLRYFVGGMEYSFAQFSHSMASMDAWQNGTRFSLPFFVFHGERDVVTPAWCAEKFFADVAAPCKALEWIQETGHFAAFVRPEEFLQLLRVHVLPVTKRTEPTGFAAIPKSAGSRPTDAQV